MLEYWNVGILEYWLVGEPEVSIAPSLHHSIAPVQAARDLKEKLFSK